MRNRNSFLFLTEVSQTKKEYPKNQIETIEILHINTTLYVPSKTEIKFQNNVFLSSSKSAK